MRTTDILTISLPPNMARQMEKIQKQENRTRSELLREAWRHYFETRYPAIKPTKTELASMRKGRTEIQKGRYVSMPELLHALDLKNRQTGRKNYPKSSR